MTSTQCTRRRHRASARIKGRQNFTFLFSSVVSCGLSLFSPSHWTESISDDGEINLERIYSAQTNTDPFDRSMQAAGNFVFASMCVSTKLNRIKSINFDRWTRSNFGSNGIQFHVWIVIVISRLKRKTVREAMEWNNFLQLHSYRRWNS